MHLNAFKHNIKWGPLNNAISHEFDPYNALVNYFFFAVLLVREVSGVDSAFLF